MGITIHYRFGMFSEESLKKVMREVKMIAESMNLDIRYFRLAPNEKTLIIDPQEESETINLEFKKWGDIKSKFEKSKEWDYTYDVMKHNFNDIPSTIWVCVSFTKTQFAGDITHIRVAEILRYLAGFCSLVLIHDEADYYETKDKKKMLKAFGECSRDMNNIIGKLKEAG